MYKIAFWILVFITIASMVLQISGYNFLDAIMFLLAMDFLALWIYLENRKSISGVDESLTRRIDSIENVCLKISESISSVSSIPILEEKISKQREDLNSMMENVNEKTLYLEEKLNKFGQFLTGSAKADREDVGELDAYQDGS